MNHAFETYVESLTPAKRMLAREAVTEYLKGVSEEVEYCNSAEKIWAKTRYLEKEADEHAVAVLMNQKMKVIKVVEVAKGGLTETIVDVRVILREALINNATCIAFVHNHPTGNVMPSKQDDKLTEAVKKACDAVRICLLDHIIIGDKCYYSYSEQGRL